MSSYLRDPYYSYESSNSHSNWRCQEDKTDVKSKQQRLRLNFFGLLKKTRTQQQKQQNQDETQLKWWKPDQSVTHIHSSFHLSISSAEIW